MSPAPYDFFAPVSEPAPAAPYQQAPPPAWPPPAWPPPAWPPPAWPPAPPFPVVAPDVSESGLSVRTGLVVTGLALLGSVALQLFGPSVANTATVVDEQLRLSLVVTLVFYVVTGLMLLLFANASRLQLVWQRAGTLAALNAGIPAGLVGGLLALALNSAVSGHLSSDPRMEALVGGGGAVRIGLAFVLTAVLAPLVEETIFRGICAGSLRAKGTPAAVLVSAAAFAVWHLNLVALRYYFFLGTLLALLWLKRGLLASMSAHAAFNGVLTIAAVLATSGAGGTDSIGGLSWHLPGGWHRPSAQSSLPFTSAGDAVAYAGPAGAGLVVVERPETAGASSLDQIRRQLSAAQPLGGGAVAAGAPRAITTPIGAAVELDIRSAGQPAHLLVTDFRGDTYTFVMATLGSPAAERAWSGLVHSLAAS